MIFMVFNFTHRDNLLLHFDSLRAPSSKLLSRFLVQHKCHCLFTVKYTCLHSDNNSMNTNSILKLKQKCIWNLILVLPLVQFMLQKYQLKRNNYHRLSTTDQQHKMLDRCNLSPVHSTWLQLLNKD